MKVAIPYWQERVSPVFDVAGRVLLVEVAEGKEQGRQDLAMEGQLRTRANLLRENGASVLICGAISRPMELAMTAAGIEVISQTCGEIERVLAAFIGGQLSEGTFLMPGCCGRRRWSEGWRCRRRGQRGGGENA